MKNESRVSVIRYAAVHVRDIDKNGGRQALADRWAEASGGKKVAVNVDAKDVNCLTVRIQ